jgi:hypothetical protein
MEISQPGPAVSGVVVTTSHVLRLAVVAYLARFKGQSRIHTESDLRGYLIWCESRGLDPLAAAPPHVELYLRWLQEVRRFARGSRRRCAGWPQARRDNTFTGPEGLVGLGFIVNGPATRAYPRQEGRSRPRAQSPKGAVPGRWVRGTGLGYADIFTMNADGSGLQQVTPSAGFRCRPGSAPPGVSGNVYTIRADGRTGARAGPGRDVNAGKPKLRRALQVSAASMIGSYAPSLFGCSARRTVQSARPWQRPDPPSAYTDRPDRPFAATHTG